MSAATILDAAEQEALGLAIVMLQLGDAEAGETIRRVAARLPAEAPEVQALTEALDGEDPEAVGTTGTALLAAVALGTLGAAPPAPGAAPAADALPGLPPDLAAEFAANARELLDGIEEAVLALEGGDTSAVEAARRLLHNLKGEAGVMGADAVQQVAHELEDQVQAHGVRCGIDPVLRACDWLRAATADPTLAPPGDLFARAAPEPVAAAPAPSAGPTSWTEEMVELFVDFAIECREGLAELDALLLAADAGRLDSGGVDAIFRRFHTIKGLAGFVDQDAIALVAHETETLLNRVRSGEEALQGDVLQAVFDATAVMPELLEETEAAIAEGRSLRAHPGLPALCAQLRVLHGQGGTPTPAPRAPAPTPAAAAAPAAPAQARLDKDAGRRLARESVKVDLDRVDRIVEMIGELVITEAMLAQSPDIARVRAESSRRILSELSKTVRSLQREGLALRMTPLGGTFRRMGRLVRDLGRELGKSISLELDGESTEMDRSLVEQLADPLMHMVRNAADHGLETAEERRAAGKSPQGTIRLSAHHSGGNVVITVADDGRGLDRDRILQRASDRGIVPPGTQLSDQEVHELIFAPGFSTATAVTTVSGRGVGMDVVKRAIEAMRGRVRISARPGQGTTFELVLPLTLAIIDGLLVEVGEARFIVPTLAVRAFHELEPRNVQRLANDRALYLQQGRTLPLVALADLVDLHADSALDHGTVMLVEGAVETVALAVDRVLGKQQVVIKPLPPGIQDSAWFSGASILGDGRVGLIFNTGAIGSTHAPASALGSSLEAVA